jgi:hypothetical protein
VDAVPVWVCVAVTVADGITAPLGSVTVPEMVAKPCALRRAVVQAMSRKAINASRAEQFQKKLFAFMLALR